MMTTRRKRSDFYEERLLISQADTPSHRLQRSHRKVRKRFLSWIQAATTKTHVGTRTIFCLLCGVTETDDDDRANLLWCCDANPKPKHHDVHLDVDDVDGDDDNLDGAVDVNE